MQPRVLISLDELAYHEEHKKSLKNLREYQKKINESTLIKKWFEFDELIDQNIATIYQKWNKEIEKVKASF
jgi:hypothetical protein